MSELQYYLKPRRALVPIRTKGNAFWRGDDRFLIKGINYFERQSTDGSQPKHSDPKIDVLADAYLPTLQRDIELFQELGLNTIAVSALDVSKNHSQAFRLLCEAGFYVLVKVSEDLHGPDVSPSDQRRFDPDFDVSSYYPLDSITSTLRLVNELAEYPNLLGFMVNGDSIRYTVTTKIGQVIRAHVRDVKAFLRQRGGRQVPVGITNSEILMLRLPAIRYFIAGPQESRIDFFAPDCWSWANPSSFQISGWKNMVQVYQEFPVPMFLRQFGAYVGKERSWGEIECLYSTDMTPVFSGGCLYTFCDRANGSYSIMDVDGRTGEMRKKREFELLKERFRTVNSRVDEEVFAEGVRDYENWEGRYPEKEEGRFKWYATKDVPEFPGDWNEVLQKLEHERSVRALQDQASRLHLEDR